MMKVHKNWLDSTLVNFLYDKFLLHTPHNYGHFSTFDKPPFYNYDFHNDDMIKYLALKIKNDFFKDEDIQILRAYINIQHQGMDGDFHQDDGTTTALYFACPTNTNKGFFQVKNKEDIISIPYVQNQLVIFDAKQFHRGLAFTNFKPRITLAFKMEKK